MKISYRCQFVERDILSVVGHKKFKEEGKLLEAIIDYINERLHPIIICQLNL